MEKEVSDKGTSFFLISHYAIIGWDERRAFVDFDTLGKTDFRDDVMELWDGFLKDNK